LKDHGYYFFNKNYITYIADTGLRNHQLDIYLYVNRINENVNPSLIGNSPVQNHNAYKLRNIYIQTDYNPKDPSASIPRDTVFVDGYYFVSSHGTFIRHQALLRNIFVHTGDTYLQRDLDYTYRRLQELNVFKFINLFFKEVKRDSVQQDYLLDLSIQLTPSDKQDVSFEFETTNTGGNLGGALSTAYRNRNTFHGAETLEIRGKFGLEAIPNFNDSVEKRKLFFFNSLEVGPDVTLTVKKFLLPNFVVNYSNPRTNFNVGYNYQDRPDYKRSVSNVSMNYVWTMGKRWRAMFFPVDVNSVNVSLSPAFRSKLESLNDPRLLYTYDTHVISGTRFTVFYSDQNITKKKNFTYFRASIEGAYKAVDAKFNPSQYTKYETDFSYHQYVNRFSTMVYRFATGVGLPYGTSRALPFEKSFFSGGANSIRAWSARTLGPGSYKRTLFIEQSGDIKVESNIEYRSELLRFPNGIIMEGATFIDAGNVWTRNEDVSRPGGKFEFENFLSELGIGGVHFRPTRDGSTPIRNL
jgi:outer membrane protein assembly factor BamA